MFRTLGIIQARLGSTRLKGKLARRLGGQSLLEWVVRRVTDCQHLDGVIVAAGDSPEDYGLAELVPTDVPIFFGSEHDVLGRYVSALEQYPAQSVVRVCADNPFIDPDLIDRLVTAADEQPPVDYISYCDKSGCPVILTSVGVYAEWCTTDALRRAAKETKDAAQREHVTQYLYTHPDRFRVRLIPAPGQLDRDDLRLTVNLEEDWEHAISIVDALGHDGIDWQRITGLLHHQPHLRKRMADLNLVHRKTAALA